MPIPSAINLFLGVCFLATTLSAPALSLAPTPPLSERLEQAEQVFIGTLVNRQESGEWVRAELRVDTPLRGAAKGEQVLVIWRSRVGNQPLYDAPEGARGIALLTDQHQGRYWLRADKFEPLSRLHEIRQLLSPPPPDTQQVPPTFEEWKAAGMPLPKGVVFPGGTPWFDESTGTRRSPEQVYRLLYGSPGSSRKPAPAPRSGPKK